METALQNINSGSGGVMKLVQYITSITKKRVFSDIVFIMERPLKMAEATTAQCQQAHSPYTLAYINATTKCKCFINSAVEAPSMH